MYSWGSFRLLMQQFAPGAPLDTLDAALNTRYEQILDHYDWSGLRAAAVLPTTAAYRSTTDTVTVAAGSNAVAGAGTAWTSAITGQRFYCPGDNAVYTATYVSPTALTLDRAYEGINPGSGKSYVLYVNQYALPADCKTVTQILDAVTGFPMERFDETILDDSVGPLGLIGDPHAWALAEDTSESTPPVLHTVELYPPPVHAYGYPVHYRRAAYGFTGQNTAASPLPWVTDAVLLLGAKADLARDVLKDLAAANVYEGLYEKELARMVREDCRRNPPPPTRMASRFVRHRLERAARGHSAAWGRGSGGPN